MLARRFTIVCLITMLFGMGFAMLVAEASRAHKGAAAQATLCQISCPEFVRR